MNGIIIVDKPKNVTSHDVVNQIRRIFNTKKVGHVGTLDPISTGVLVVMIGNTTKLAPFLENDSKEYIARIRFGVATDSYDITGNVVDSLTDFKLNEQAVDDILTNMIGVQNQKPPIYSAVKVSGKKLYEYARNNKEVDIPTRQVEIYKAERINDICYDDEYAFCDVLFSVSKGTYIRSIIDDLGKKINIPCCMEELKRIRSGKFSIDESSKIEDILVGNYRLIKPLDIIDMPILKVEKDSEHYRKAINGMKISPSIFETKPFRFAVECENNLIAIYELNENEIPHYKSIRVWNE